MDEKIKIKAYLAYENCIYALLSNDKFYKFGSDKKLIEITDENILRALKAQLAPPKTIDENGNRYIY